MFRINHLFGDPPRDLLILLRPRRGERDCAGARRQQAADPHVWFEPTAHLDVRPEYIGDGRAILRLGQPTELGHLWLRLLLRWRIRLSGAGAHQDCADGTERRHGGQRAKDAR